MSSRGFTTGSDLKLLPFAPNSYHLPFGSSSDLSGAVDTDYRNSPGLICRLGLCNHLYVDCDPRQLPLEKEDSAAVH